MTSGMPRCGHMCEGGDGIMRSCDKALGHEGWHGETVTLRGSTAGTYRSTTNWGDDGKGIHASKGRELLDGRWVHPVQGSVYPKISAGR